MGKAGNGSFCNEKMNGPARKQGGKGRKRKKRLDLLFPEMAIKMNLPTRVIYITGQSR